MELQKHVIEENGKMILIASLEFVVEDCESSNVLNIWQNVLEVTQSAIGIER